MAYGRLDAVTKLLFDDLPQAHANGGHGKVLGCGLVGTHAGDMIGEIALAIEMGSDAVYIGKTIHPHPINSQTHALQASALRTNAPMPNGNRAYGWI
jgi:dihydrolipoamide dehydrogenase